MKKLLITTSLLAVSSVAANAETFGPRNVTNQAGVALMSPDETGFIWSAGTEVSGVGAASAQVQNGNANFVLTGWAMSGNDLDNAGASTGVISAMQFDRTVSTSGSLVGAGRAVAQGEATMTVGSVGAADAKASVGSADASTESARNSSAESSSTASLIGAGSTSVLAGLVGTNAGFAGATGTTVSTSQLGLAIGGLTVYGDESGIEVLPFELGEGGLEGAFEGILGGLGLGESAGGQVGFMVGLAMGENGLDLGIANAGGGTISLTASTGGFFSGGASAIGKALFGTVGD